MNNISSFIKTFSVFAGTIIGVGIFGLPYVASKAGFPIVVLYFVVMTAVAIFVHWIYAEVTLGTDKLHRFPGYVNEYLGLKWKKFTFFTTALGLSGALLAYLIVGGEFLHLYFSPYFGGSPAIYTLIFFSIGAILVFRGIKSISQIELIFLFLFIVLLAIFFARGFEAINPEYFKNIDLRFFTFPYGVIMFSVWGAAIVPQIKEMLGGNRSLLKSVIFSGISFASIIYLIFIITIFGVSGPDTSKEAFAGFGRVLGDGTVKLGFIFGIITTFTSFITLALVLKETLWLDFGLSKNLAWFAACFIPLILFFAGFREFISVIGFVGAVSLGLEAIILILMYKKFLAVKFSRSMPAPIFLLAGIFILGIIFETAYIFFVKI